MLILGRLGGQFPRNQTDPKLRVDIQSLSVCQNISKIKKNCLESYLLDEELVLEVREGGFKLGGVLLDVPTVYTVPVVLVTVDGYTVAVLF